MSLWWYYPINVFWCVNFHSKGLRISVNEGLEWIDWHGNRWGCSSSNPLKRDLFDLSWSLSFSSIITPLLPPPSPLLYRIGLVGFHFRWLTIHKCVSSRLGLSWGKNLYFCLFFFFFVKGPFFFFSERFRHLYFVSFLLKIKFSVIIRDQVFSSMMWLFLFFFLSMFSLW